MSISYRFPRVALTGIVLLIALLRFAHAESARVYATDGVAISGYDAVIYITENRAAKGSNDHALMWHGVVWLFVSDDTMEAFEMNPTAYAPQYGGYCAMAVSEGRLAASSPEMFTVTDGKLYLNSSAAIQESWRADMAGHIESADRNWPAVLGH